MALAKDPPGSQLYVLAPTAVKVAVSFTQRELAVAPIKTFGNGFTTTFTDAPLIQLPLEPVTLNVAFEVGV